MKVLYSWLREFAPIEGDPQWLADQMSDLGMAVESMTPVGDGLGDIVVARVAGLRPHPDADRIQLVDVDAGGDLLQVCCGAFNMAQGDLVPLAPVGAVLPDGLEISQRKMRGQLSQGMLCSASELGLFGDTDGIMVLGGLVGEQVTTGQPLVDALGIASDVMFELEINPNRPDAMSVAGVARDLAARLGVPFSLPRPAPATSGVPAGDRVSVTVASPDLCGRFTTVVLDNVTVGPSPWWLAQRLEVVGMRSVNNIVDLSNYVMWELGTPNHAYDLETVSGATLGVRWARPGETVVTLDEVERSLDGGDGVITDGSDTPIAIAGLMGGASTEISATTSTVAVEFAWWDPMSIARSSRRLGLRSEASARFERGCDPDVVGLAALRFAELASQFGATLAPGSVAAEGNLPEPATVVVRTRRVNDLLGTDLGPPDIAGALEPIGFGCTPVDAPGGGDVDHEVSVPSWRPDSATETDVIEEIARHIGYSSIPLRRPARATTGGLSARQQLRRRLRNIMVGLGASEAMPTPLLSADDLGRSGLDATAVTITNPLAAEESLLRTSLRPGLLRSVAHNASHRNPDVALFEVGRVFHPSPGGQALPDEPEMVALVLSGVEAPGAVAALDVVADSLGIAVSLEVAEPAGLHPTRSATVTAQRSDGSSAGDVGSTGGGSSVPLGLVGEIDPDVATQWGLSGPVAWLELDVDALESVMVATRTYRAVSRFPSADVDLAFELDESVPASALRSVIVEAAGGLLVGLELFDVYRGPGVAERTRSLAHRLRLQAVDRTLTDDEVGEVRQRVVDSVTTTLPASLR